MAEIEHRLVVRPLQSIINDQISEARNMGLSAASTAVGRVKVGSQIMFDSNMFKKDNLHHKFSCGQY